MTAQPLCSLRDVYRIGRGPSSSHTMGPRRAAEMFGARHADATRFRVVLYGSLAATGAAHLTDQTVVEAFAPRPCAVRRDETRAFDYPNALRLEALDAGGAALDAWLVYSVGGGALRDERGPVDEAPAAPYPVADIKGALAWCARENKPLWALPVECELGILDDLARVWQAMQASIRRGLESDQYILPGGLAMPRKAESAYARARNLTGLLRETSLVSSFALAVAEENAAGGEVVTAPTCGSAGVLPAVLYYFATTQNASDRQVLHALATAGLFGATVKTNASISGAEVGCQGEVGVACAMAAAAATHLLGGTPTHIEYAAEMGLEHHLGLTCDPVLGLVQIPCIERNAVGAVRALNLASYALLGDGRHVISFDEVVEVMYATGRDMQSAYRETAAGGLAEIWRRRRARHVPPETTERT